MRPCRTTQGSVSDGLASGGARRHALERVFPLSRHLALTTLAFAVVAVWALVLLGAPTSNSAHAASQVPLTASYTVVGGSGTGVQDLLTYVSGGQQEVVPLTSTPTPYLVDAGSQWSVLNVLNGSTGTERWVASTGDLSGTISTPQMVSFTYYHQYLVTFNFKVVNGGGGYSGPSVSVDVLGSPALLTAPAEKVWVDASSPYSYASQLPGSSSDEQWVLPSGGSGVVNQTWTFSKTYWHQYLVSSSFSIVGGGTPTPPTLSGLAFGMQSQVSMTSFTRGTWLDAGATYTFTSPLSPPGTPLVNETWTGTVVVLTKSGNVLSTDNNGTVTGPLSITPVYYHQYLVGVTFAYIGGSTADLTLPPLTYQAFGSQATVDKNATVWVEADTPYTLPEDICCVASPLDERWELTSATTGTISSATTIAAVYYHQYVDSFFYSVVGQQPPGPLAQPVLTYDLYGSPQHLALVETPQTFWADAGSAYSAATTISGTASERWFSALGTGSIIGPAPANTVDIAYTQQYLLTVVGGGVPTQWVNAGNDTTLSTPGVYGRSAGVGYRITTYRIDAGAMVPVSETNPELSIQMSMNGPHSIAFTSVVQFQVTLDAGGTGALSSITSPTIPGDNYWYDSGSPVQVFLTGEWGRANGIGHRISTVSASAQSTFEVDTLGLVQAYSTQSIDSPVSIATTSVTQYEVVLNKAAFAAFVSISPPSTFTGDTYWYDSGSPAATVVLDGIYARSAGIGLRTTSWELGSGPITKVAQTGTIAIVTKAMTAPQFVNATSVTQYQVTLDKGGSSALSSITSPTIPLDSGWYDSSTPVGVIMNGMWGRASGTGQRLAGYSINGGSEVTVASTGLVQVLNLPAISSPQAITTTVVTQYQVTLDSGATSALYSITPTSIPQDKYWFDSGTPVSVSLDGLWNRGSTTGTRLASFSLNSGPSTTVLSSSPVKVLALSGIAGPESIATKTVAQYHLSSSPVPWASLTNSTLPGDAAGWFDSGTTVKAVYNAVWNQTSTASRESVVSYAVDSGAKTNVARSGTGTFTVTLSMTQAHTISVTSATQYLLAVLGPAKVTASPPSQTGDSYFDAGSKVTFAVQRVSNGTLGPVRG